MTVSQMTEAFLLNMGYSRADAAEPDVVEEYAPSLARWLNEGYARAVQRLCGREAAEALAPAAGRRGRAGSAAEALHRCWRTTRRRAGRSCGETRRRRRGCTRPLSGGLAEAARGEARGLCGLARIVKGEGTWRGM